jgi:hypothetical protein
MPVQRILLIVAVLVSWLGPLAPGHDKVSERPDSLNLGAAPSEPHEVRVGVQVRQIKFVNQKAENFGIVGKLRLEWDDPELVFDAEQYGREFRVYEQEDFKALANENSLFYPGFIIQN